MVLVMIDLKVWLIVKDEGIGIVFVDCKKVFEKFYWVGNEDIWIIKGIGLGLFIVKELVCV